MIEPLFDRILAQEINNEHFTKSGISLSYSSNESVKKAIVIKTGKGVYEDGIFIDMQVKEKDIIYYEEHVVSKLSLDDMEYILIKQTDVLAYEKTQKEEERNG